MPLRPSSIAQVSPEIEAVLQIALAKDRDARFSTAAELAAAFRSAAAGHLDDELVRRAVALPPWAEPPKTVG